MSAKRPFATEAEMVDAADRMWSSLAPPDWLEAFAAHPRIGEDASSDEQGGMRSAGSGVRERLAQANREYEARFGYIFIVCATGKSAEEMLARLERRLFNAPDDELRIAGEEQGKITRLRLAKLVSD